MRRILASQPPKVLRKVYLSAQKPLLSAVRNIRKIGCDKDNLPYISYG